MNRTVTPNSCLTAILLVTRSTSGPDFVFHYPPRPKPSTQLTTSRRVNNDYGTSDSSSSENSDYSDPEEDDRNSRGTVPGIAATEISDTESRSRGYLGGRRQRRKREDAQHRKKSVDGGYPWESVLGFKAEFLANLLAPKDALCKTKFELSIDDMVFVGFPLHVRPDGAWRRKKRRRGTSGEEEGEDEKADDADDEDAVGGGGGVGGLEDLSAAVLWGNGDDMVSGGEQHNDDADDERDDDADDEEASGGEGTMSMFHVVFVLNPPELEYHFRTQEIFDYVIKRFTRALKYEQAKDGYVWREARKIIRLREQAAQKDMGFSELWKQILEQSSLAHAIHRIYSDISQSKISHVFLNKGLGMSLQIPIVSDIAVLPSITDPQVPGLPLTTAISFGDDETEGDLMLAKHFTLLFLEDVDGILKDIAAENSETSSSLAHFVKSCKPTLSFLQIANQFGMPLHEIQILARHLIHWRKARAIPPIHQRDIYIVSPNADMRSIQTLTPIYARAFPMLVSLPKVLSLLSTGKPKPFSAIVPSRDHRTSYLDMLAWLIRHGLVTQLRNFCWIKIPRRIKLLVAAEQRLASANKETSSKKSRKSSKEKEKDKESTSPTDTPPSSPHLEPMTNMISSTNSLLSNSIASLRDELPQDSVEITEELEDSFVLEPHQASSTESAWLEMMTRDQPPDIKALFDRCMKYLNGQHAVEKIAVREGISRKEVRRVLGALDEFLVFARHW